MSVSGVCQVCESAEASQTCPNCGAMVCSEHYDRELSICVRCASAARQSDDQTSEIDQSDVMR
ncbi:hypothetical protein AUR64_15680 [Haloprofundus marisrubri]|uniref:HIT-type domain-containing protein n=1 Tax=Haloprofundus marisrubri TaxID=1514971 RepID=A0A0W1R720_9EURY|nr:zinc finger HIT domain-containing protein [Haloprofundus marisrubri]KTG09230.1 hypothetical protein AUR64_15680 [Haloprofundus marisrubri]